MRNINKIRKLVHLTDYCYENRYIENMSSASLDIGIPCRRIDRQSTITFSEAITNSTCCITFVKITNEKRVRL